MPEAFSFPSDLEAIGSTQRQILTEAAHTLGVSGIGGLDAKSIAARLGISPSLINHYYRSIEELAFDAALFSYSALVAEIRDLAERERDPEKVARMWVERMLEWLKGSPGVGVILEFPRQVMRAGGKQPENPEGMLAQFTREMSTVSAQNVAVMASAVRAMQTGRDMEILSPVKVAGLIKIDPAFAAYTSLMGFATIGAGLWIAGRRPGERGLPFWRQLGFNPTQQTKHTIDHLITLIRLNSPRVGVPAAQVPGQP